MNQTTVSKSKVPWYIGGLTLALIQILAVALVKPLGVSTQFVVADSMVIHQTTPGYAENHPLISQDKYRKTGYGFWLDVGLLIGAAAAGIALGTWKLRTTCSWWDINFGHSIVMRFITCFLGGFFILFGARLAHGCTSGQFASGWAQLSVSAIPFTIAMFVFGISTAFLLYRKTPAIEK